MSNRTKLFKIILMLILVIIISNVIRFYPIIEYSDMASQFAGGYEYFLDYIKNTGHILERGEIIIYGIYSNMIYGQSSNPIFAILITIIELYVGDLSPILLKIVFYSMFALIFLVVVFLFSKNKKNKNPDIYLCGLIACFSLLGVPTFIIYMDSNAAIGWILITLSLYLFTKKADVRMQFLFLLLPCVLPLMYFTPSMLYLLLLFILMCYALIAETESRYRIFAIFSFIFYSIIWFIETSRIAGGRLDGVINLFLKIYLIYHNLVPLLVFLFCCIFVIMASIYFNRNSYIFKSLKTRCWNFVRGHNRLILGATLIFLIILASRYVDLLRESVFINSGGVGNTDISKYLINTSGKNKLRLAFNAFFVSLPVLYFIVYGNRKIISQNRSVLWTMIISLVPLSLLFYGWLGTLGLARLAEWGGLVSIISFSAMINSVDDLSRKLLSLIVIIACISSVNAYLNDENIPTLHLTTAEEHGSKWILLSINKDRCIFTDFRLAGSLVGNNHLRVTGANEAELGLSSFIEALNAIYYNNSSSAAIRSLNNIVLMNGQHVEYLFFSNQMERTVPGIKGYDYGCKPAPIGFERKFDDNYIRARVYDNGIAYVYQF
jgi:hypothetical protein